MIEVFQSGIMPNGQFDVKDSEAASIKGGEVLVIDTAASTDFKVADIYSSGSRIQLRLATESDTGPFFLANSGNSISQANPYQKSFYSTSSDPSSLDVSSKQGAFTDEGFYAVSSDVVESDIVAGTLPNTLLYVSNNGKLTTTVSSSQNPIGVLVEYRESSVVNSNPNRPYKTAGTFKDKDSVIFFKSNTVDGYTSAVGASPSSSLLVVADNTERDSIDSAFREEGMLVSVLGTRSVYTLRGGITNSDWEEVLYLGPTNTSVRDLYVDTVAGDDSNVGTALLPLKTIQRAVDIFIPPHAPTQTWDANDDRTINVVYTLGMPEITESIHIPYHRGAGALIIDGDEEVVETLVQDGALATVDGYYAVNQIDFTTSPLTLDANKSQFIKGPDSVSLPKALDRCTESMPIAHNGTGYVWAVGMPSAFTAAVYFGDAVELEITSPRIDWSPPPPAAFTYSPEPSIRCDGGNVIIQGFNFEGKYASTFATEQIIDIGTSGGFADSGKNVCLLRCNINNYLNPISSSVLMSSCIYNHVAGGDMMSSVGGGAWLQNIYIPTSSGIRTWRVNGLDIFGLYSEAKFYIHDCNVGTISGLDNRNGRIDLVGTSCAIVKNISVEQAGDDSALSVGDQSYIAEIQNVKGTTGNNVYGLSILNQSMVRDSSGTRTLAGAIGEVGVGDDPFVAGTTTTWNQGGGGGRVTTTNDFSIYQELP